MEQHAGQLPADDPHSMGCLACVKPPHGHYAELHGVLHTGAKSPL